MGEERLTLNLYDSELIPIISVPTFFNGPWIIFPLRLMALCVYARVGVCAHVSVCVCVFNVWYVSSNM